MPKRFPLPTVTRRHFSLLLSILVLVLGAAYLVYFRVPQPAPQDSALQTFRNACVKAARHANGGGDLVMDDATEAKIGDYCGCVAEAIQGNVAPGEVAKLAEGTASPATGQLLDRIISGCKPRLR